MTGNRSGAMPRNTGPVDARLMRQSNLSLVLRSVLSSAPTSQAEIIKSSGLRKPTVSKLVEELARAGWIWPVGESRGPAGRPSLLWAPNPAKGIMVAAHAAIDGFSVLVVDFADQVITRRAMSVGTATWSAAKAVRTLGLMINDSLSEASRSRPNRPVLGIAVAVPGVVTADLVPRFAPGVQWVGSDIRSRLRLLLRDAIDEHCPILLDNDANLAAVAEFDYRSIPGRDNMVYVNIGHGVGGGVIVGGELFRGASRAGGEIGHVTIDLDGPLCPCGKRGCWAVVLSREIARMGSAADDAGVVRAFIRCLAAGVGNLISVYDPAVVILGGTHREAIARQLNELNDELRHWVIAGDRSHFRLELGSFDSDAACWGGVASLRRHLSGVSPEGPLAISPVVGVSDALA